MVWRSSAGCSRRTRRAASRLRVLGWSVAEQRPDAGFAVVELAADAAVAQVDWPGAAAVLQEFVTRVPNHIPALMRLVEICVDGGLEATMYSAQAQLADAYIAAGAATEARFIAEDLVAREPWDKSNIERFRRALVLLGEPDPDALIAQRLSGESPFTSTDLFAPRIRQSPEPAPPAGRPTPSRQRHSPTSLAPRMRPKSRPGNRRRSPAKPRAKHGSTLRAERQCDRPRQHPRRLRHAARHRAASAETRKWISASCSTTSNAATAVPPAPPPAPAASDLDGVFGKLRDQARAGDGRGGEGIQARAGAARSGRHRRVHQGAGEGLAGAEAAVCGDMADSRASIATAT